jgi:hypothetical protein
VIQTPTLFVLGAGASQPYGLPLGSELRTLICDAESDGNPAAGAVEQEGLYTHAKIRNVARAFLHSNVRSIDEFLARQPHLADVGKALIAAIICSKENPNELSSEDNPDHWCRVLWNALIDGAMQGQDISQNKVRFITFNYDRSLESFLHQSTINTYGLTGGGAFNYWSRLQVMHVYGSVGDFNFSERADRSRPYNTEIRPRELSVAAGGINIIPEGRDDGEVFETARQWFDWAKHVYILGFGFDRLNCDRLGFSSVMAFNRDKKKPPPSINASVLGLTHAEVTRARRRLIGDAGDWTTHNAMNAMTLRLAGFPD